MALPPPEEGTARRQWTLETATSSYVVSLDSSGLVLDYWGAKTGLPVPPAEPARPHFATRADVAPLEYASMGTRHVTFADLLVDRGNGRSGAAWEQIGVVEHMTDVGGSTLSVPFVDTSGTLRLTLTVSTAAHHDVVRRQAKIENLSQCETVTLRRVFSGGWALPVGQNARIDYLAGAWGKEFTRKQLELEWGAFTIGSRGGVTSHAFSPVVCVSSSELTAGVPERTQSYGVALEWSGSWRLVAESTTVGDRVRVSCGVDDDSTTIVLSPGEEFISPQTVGVWSDSGPEGVSRAWHVYQRSLSRSLDPDHRPIVYNSWYATRFDVTAENQLELATAAADLGVETFVIDDGWFAGRHDTTGGLGDWMLDEDKFPRGLRELAESVERLGLRFGLWVEPEAVSDDSELYRCHPDWIYRAEDRTPVKIRNQFTLDLGRPEVEAWVADMLRRVLGSAPISYLKWDMNRPITDGGRPGDTRGTRWSVDHTRAYYRLLGMIRAEFPSVVVEACSAGGARIDNAVLALTDVVWPSDETGPMDRLAVQHGFLSAYPAHVMSSWVTDKPGHIDRRPTSLEFRFLVAMLGVLGIGADIVAWSEEDLATGRRLIQLYKDVRTLIFTGDVSIHGVPDRAPYAVEYGASPADPRICVFVFDRDRERSARPARVFPSLLDPLVRYRLRGSEATYTGASAASAGVEVPFVLAPDADVLVFEPIDG